MSSSWFCTISTVGTTNACCNARWCSRARRVALPWVNGGKCLPAGSAQFQPLAQQMRVAMLGGAAEPDALPCPGSMAENVFQLVLHNFNRWHNKCVLQC